MRHWNWVSQLKLFDSCQGILADDERGRITDIPCLVDAETARATQIHYTHAVPKTSTAIGERISLAFRVKPDQQPPKANEDGGGDREPARMGE